MYVMFVLGLNCPLATLHITTLPKLTIFFMHPLSLLRAKAHDRKTKTDAGIKLDLPLLNNFYHNKLQIFYVF
jgi:hypothetical protein